MKLAEDEHTEFKRAWSDSAKRSIVAFANTDGGTIYIGVDDDGTVIGVKDPDQCMRQAIQAAANAILPDILNFISVSTNHMEGLPVVVVQVRRGTHPPYYLADKGPRPAGVYIRSGAASIPATETAILDMLRQSAPVAYEDMPSFQQQLTFIATKAFFDASGIPFGEHQHRSLGLLTPDGVYTNLALLLSDQCMASIKVAAFADIGKEAFQSRSEITGPLPQQFEQVRSLLSQYNHVRSAVGPDMRRVDEYDFPPDVLREALLNLIIHRDYGISAPSLISVLPDHIEFVNLGGLPTGLTKQDMLNGISVQRNPKLASIFYRLRLVEAYGTGIRRITHAYAHMSAKPVFSITDHTFSLSIPALAPNPPTKEDPAISTRVQDSHSPTKRIDSHSGHTDEHESLIRKYVRDHGVITRAEAQQITGMSQAAAARLLRAMVEKGRLRRVGNGPSTAYRIKE